MRVKTPTLLQIEAAECGAAALGIVLRYYGRYVPLEELRVVCGVSRDGNSALNLVKAAQYYGLSAQGLRRSSIDGLKALPFPQILFWNFNHFVVLEGFDKKVAYLNDPASGARRVSLAEFDGAFTGLTLSFEPTADFRKAGQPFRLIRALRERLAGLRAGLIYLLLVSLFLLIPAFVIPAFLRVFVDDILIGGQNWLIPLLLGMALAALLRAALTWLQQMALLRLEIGVATRTSAEFFAHALRLPMTFFAQRYAGDIAARVELNQRVAGLLSGDLALALINLLLMLVYALLMFQYSVLLTGVGIGFSLLNLGVLRLVSRRRTDANRTMLQERGRLIGALMGGLRAVETFKSQGAENDLFARWSGLQARLINVEQRLGSSTQLLTAVSVLLFALNAALLLVIGGEQVLDGALTVGMLVAFQSLMFSFSQPVGDLVNLGSRLQEVEGDLSQLEDVLDYPLDPPRDQLQGQAGLLEVSGLSFGYDPLKPPLIEDFSLTLQPGERVALVGASGSGKTTLARLIAGLYPPRAVEIRLNGSVALVD